MTSSTRTVSDLLIEQSEELASKISSSARGAALANLRYATDDLTRAQQQRNTLIVLARSVGCSLREIAEATDLSAQGVAKITRRLAE